jgi:hypothetical protein
MSVPRWQVSTMLQIQRRFFGFVYRRQLFGVMIVACDLSLPLLSCSKVQPIKNCFRF